MKTIFRLLPIFLLGISLFLYSFKSPEVSISRFHSSSAIPPYSSGFGSTTNQDNTGSPLSTGSCANCHNGASYGTSIVLSMKDGGGNSVTSYTPGNSYTLEYKVTSTSGTKYGVQGTILTSSNAKAGTMGTPTSTATHVISISNRDYIEQSSAATGTSNQFSFTVPWTAPASGTGTITMYGIGLTVNGNGSTNGDKTSSPASLQITESTSSSNTSVAYTSSTFCNSGTTSTPTVNGITNGTFSSTSGLSINSSTGVINLANSTPGTYTITCTDGTNSATATITIVTPPTITATTPASICGFGIGQLSATASSGTVNWYANATGGTSLGSNSNFSTPSLNTTTTYYVEANNNGCVSSPRTAVVATVTPRPTMISTTPGSRCGPGTVLLGASPSAGTVNWYASIIGGTSLGSGTSFTTPSISSTTTYYALPINGTCQAIMRTAVVATITNSTATPIITVTGNSTICQGDTVVLTSSSTTDNSWSNGATTPTINVTTSGTYTVTVSPAGCNSATSTGTIVTVNALPTVSLSALNDVCINTPAFSLNGGQPTGGNYSGNGVSNNQFTPSTAGIGTTTIQYTYMDANSCSNVASNSITVSDCAEITELSSGHFLVYPNPSGGKIQIQSSILIESILIVDQMGRSVFQKTIFNPCNQIEMDVSFLENGLYTIIINNQKEPHKSSLIIGR